MSPRAWRSVQAVISVEIFFVGLVMYALSWGTWQPPVIMTAGVLGGMPRRRKL
jgi:hypothetical protein